MTRPFLFGGSASGSSQNKYLVEFRAGKMSMKDKIVSADKRKGLLYVHQSDDTLMHFCWKDRTSGVVEDDLIIFPDDVIFKKVECTPSRVYVLKFKSSSRKCFYWMQEPKTDRDTELCGKVNQYLNNPPSGSSRGGAGSSLGGSTTPSQGGGGLQSELSSLGDGDLHSLLNNMSQQQLIQLLGGVGGVSGMPSLSSLLGSTRLSSAQSASSERSSSSTQATETPRPSAPTSAASTTTSQPATPTPTRATTTSATTRSAPSSSSSATAPSIQLSDLQNILSGLNVPPESETPTASNTSVDLSSALTAEALQPLFNDKQLMERLNALLPPTPDGNAPFVSENLQSTVQSPQFQQALGIFSAALQSGQLGPLMQQFGMPQDVIAAATSGDVDAFVRALQDSKNSSTPSSEKPKDKDNDKDEDMSLD